jgi:tetratricopeptide (TPR) repeat protein
MSLQFARNAALVLMIVASAASAAALSDGLQKGKNYYFAGEFKKAIAQFELAAEKDPNDGEPYLWLGKSYALLADTKAPILSTRTRLKARRYLAKAVQLAPDCVECRRELFDFLVDSDNSRSELRQAKALIENTPESDLDYPWMRSSLAQARKQHFSPEYLTGQFFAGPSRAFAQLSLHPAPVLRVERRNAVTSFRSYSGESSNTASPVQE